MSEVSENVLPVGTRLADYEIVDVLGEGGFGIVYLAFDHSLHRNVAIKEYMPSALALRGGDAGVSLRAERHQDTFRLGLKSFINEARFLAQFDHPALVKVHRYWEQNRTAYTAMQYYDGRTIKDIVNHNPELVDEAWCLRVLANILQALDMLYAMQIVHRDVSPDNIIVQASGEAVLLDFGSARQVIGDMTRGLTVILKPGYAPVEQYAGDASLEQGAYTDIYALAAVMYFAITGKPPASSIARMIQDPLVPLTVLAPPGYSPAFLAAIDKGLAVLAQDRPQTIESFRSMLGIAPPPASASTSASSQRAAAAPLRAPLAAPGAEGAAAAQPATPSPITVRMPVIDAQAPPAAAIPQPSAGGAAPRPKKNWPPVLAAALLLVIAAWGLARLLHDGAEDTVMLAQQQPRSSALPPAPEAAAAAASVLASAEGLAGAAPAAAAAAASPLAASATLDPQESVLPAAPAPLREPAAAATAATAAAKPAPDTATVNFAIKPWGTVFVDGRERGVSPPLKRLTLPAGQHQIRVVNPGFTEFRTSVEISRGKNAAIDHDFAHAR